MMDMKSCSYCDTLNNEKDLKCSVTFCKHRYCQRCLKKNKEKCMICEMQNSPTKWEKYLKDLALKTPITVVKNINIYYNAKT